MAALVQALESSVNRHPAEGLLLSGGLDTSVLAALAARRQKPYCLTVAWRGAPAPDIEYAKKAAARFYLNHAVHYFGEEQLESGLQAVVPVLGTFDPMEIRNSVACYIGLQAAREKGLSSVMTGDGGDELLAGYSFLFDLTPDKLAAELAKMWSNMSFSSLSLAKHLGIEVSLPFLDSEFKSLAMRLDPGLLIEKHNGQTYGKWILRRAFESILFSDLVWRVKAPLEVGCGTTALPSFYEACISNSEYAEKKERYLVDDKVRLRSKEHLHYYEIYRRCVGVPCLSAANVAKCPECGGSVKENTAYCRICGSYPI